MQTLPNKTNHSVGQERERDNNKNISKKMIEIWNKIIPEKFFKSANKFLSKKLEQALDDQLDGKIDHWITVCKNYRSSKFLMGNAIGVQIKPDIGWLVNSKEPRAQYVFAKTHYTFDDRDSFSESGVSSQKIKTEHLQTSIEKSSDDACAVNDADGVRGTQIKNLKLWLLRAIGCDAYRSWFEKVDFQISNQIFLIFSSSHFARDEIENRYGSLLQKHLANFTQPLTLRILKNEV